MKILTSSVLLAAALTLLPAAFAQNADRAAQLLASAGSIRVAAVGPYVNVGTCRVQVSAKLGQPSTVLADGTWLYDSFTANGSDATGTLVVRFVDGRVSSLSLASPVVVTALRAQPRKTGDRVLLAAWNQR